MTLEGGFTTVQSVGAAIDARGPRPHQPGLPPRPRVLTSFRQIQGIAGDPEALRALVRKTKADGADVIKLFATTGLGAGGGQTMTDEQIQAACGEAKAVGLRSVVHAIGDAGALAAVHSGLHLDRARHVPGDATLDLMAQLGTFFDPNLLVLHNYLDKRAGFDLHRRALDTLQEGHPAHRRRAAARPGAHSEDRIRHRRRRRLPRPQCRGVRLPGE